MIDGRKKVAFICVHNSCRSQIAEALGKHLASDVFESYSAGTETKPQINQDAVRLMKELYGIDMELTQKSKLLEDIPQEQAEIVRMKCYDNLTFREIAELEEIPEATVKSRYRYAIQHIQQRLRKEKSI